MTNVIMENGKNINKYGHMTTLTWGQLNIVIRKNKIIHCWNKKTYKDIYIYNGQQFKNYIDCKKYYDQCNK